ncbi:MAG TPA: hypothetical protein VK760_12715 [Candidatus Acidoferrales bacterium]|jgi:hypothetical protein|nr:hypothetical protein [Candidatus Acidoferrales bacterium]
MRYAQAAFWAALVAFAGTLAALVAHVAIDVAGDYLLAHDTYDDIPHESRALFLVALAAIALAVSLPLLFDLLDRRCASTASLLRRVRASLGSPVLFALVSTAFAVLTLAGMEWMDCSAARTPVDGIEDLFGGSLVLGLGLTLALGCIGGWLVHRFVRLIAGFEPHIAALLFRLVRAACSPLVPVLAAQHAPASRTIVRSLLLARRGSKRGPPLPTLR